MKRYLIATLLIVPLLSASAFAATTEDWVNDHAGEEEAEWFQYSQGNEASTGASSDDDQVAEANRTQTGAVSVEEVESNDDSDVDGSNILPIVGNDILNLNNADILSDILSDDSQQDNSSTSISQSRTEDNDRTTIVDDAFNDGDRAPIVVLQPQARRVVDTRPVGDRLPTTGQDFLWPLALGIWLVVAGSWMLRRGSHAFGSRLSA